MSAVRAIYVASSWRNGYQPGIVRLLRAAGHRVYDFRNPTAGPAREGARGIGTGFRWSEADPEWQQWTPGRFVRALEHPISVRGFDADYNAMCAADTCVLLLPCGRSAHLEAGYFVGARKELFLLMPEPMEPELMYRMATAVCLDVDELVARLALPRRESAS